MRHIVLLLFVILSGCVPPFSEMQSAATLGRNNNEITAFYSRVDWINPDDQGRLQNHVGAIGGVGLTPRLDMRVRWERIQIEGVDEAQEVIGVGPKLALIPGKLALYVPAGFKPGDDKSGELHPTIIASAQLTPWLESTASVKALIFLYHDNEP